MMCPAAYSCAPARDSRLTSVCPLVEKAVATLATRVSRPHAVGNIRDGIRRLRHRVAPEWPRLIEGDGPFAVWRRWVR